MIIRAAQEADAPAMGRLMVETWLAAHKGQIPEGQWQARQKNCTPEVSARGWAETWRDMAAGESPDFCIYLALETADSGPLASEIISLVTSGPVRSLSWPEAGEIYAVYVRQAWQGDQWRIALFQNTPAQFHGRPELTEALTEELRALL